MIVSNEQANVDIVYIFGAKSKEELQDKIIGKLRERYTVIGENEIDFGEYTEYNARMMIYIYNIKKRFIRKRRRIEWTGIFQSMGHLFTYGTKRILKKNLKCLTQKFTKL